MTISPARPRWLYRHSARMRSGPAPRVTASGAEGLSRIAVTLRKPGTPATGTYAVRLYFAEHNDALASGDRIFAVSLQGEKVMEQLDVARETGGNAGLVKEFRGIHVIDNLTIKLIPVVGSPTLCGIEAVLENARRQYLLPASRPTALLSPGRSARGW